MSRRQHTFWHKAHCTVCLQPPTSGGRSFYSMCGFFSCRLELSPRMAHLSKYNSSEPDMCPPGFAPICTCYIYSLHSIGCKCSTAHGLALNNSEKLRYRNTFLMHSLSTQWPKWVALQKTVLVCVYICVWGHNMSYLSVSPGCWLETQKWVSKCLCVLRKQKHRCVFVCVQALVLKQVCNDWSLCFSVYRLSVVRFQSLILYTVCSQILFLPL